MVKKICGKCGSIIEDDSDFVSEESLPGKNGKIIIDMSGCPKCSDATDERNSDFEEVEDEEDESF